MQSTIDPPAQHPQFRGNRLFEGMPCDLLDEITPAIEVIHLEGNETLFREGEAGDSLYLVETGCIRISKQGRGGQQETLSFIKSNDFFGELALLDGQPRSACASAVEPTVLGRLNHTAFDRIFNRASRNLHANVLRSAIERLREVNVHYITELMRTERLSLVGSMANSIIHDLKNPLQCVRSCAEMMAMKRSASMDGELVKILNQATDSMLDMIQELLDFARGKSSIQMKRMPAHDILQQLDMQLKQLVPPRIQMVCEGTECPAEIMVDGGRFARMLLNLIKNSVEAMPGGGSLCLRLREQDQRIIFGVCDTGCGIEPDLQPKIFEPFVTFGKSKGTGLGMAIVKSVAEAHGGTITLTSEVGVGTTVEVSLPAV